MIRRTFLFAFASAIIFAGGLVTAFEMWKHKFQNTDYCNESGSSKTAYGEDNGSKFNL